MSGKTESGRRQPRIDAPATAAFLAALRAGARREEAAAGGGFTLMGFYGARRRDPGFAADWAEAMSASADARPATPLPAAGETRIVPNNRRVHQRRKLRNVRFDEQRRQLFLAHFAWSCDTREAAAAAGVCESTVSLHRRNDPAFEAEFRAALDRGYVLLEAEALRQRLEAQRRLREALEASEPAAPVPSDLAAEFERVLKLLARWDRKPRRPERQASPDGRREPWSFEGAIALLNRRLARLGMEVPPLPTEIAARYDGPAESEGEGAA
jgi:hypothetical protein